MTHTALLYLPFLISITMGVLLVDLLFPKTARPPLPLRLFLGSGAGLGLSSQIAFYSFAGFDGYHRTPIILIHGVIVLGLAGAFFLSRRTATPAKDKASGPLKNLLLYGLLIIACIPLWSEARYYPLGGWDAWQVWNFKARFLFLAGTRWEDLFLPILWRSSPHYPLLLPLINVWGWSFINVPVPTVPLITSIVFTFMTTGLLLAALGTWTRSWTAVLPALLVLTLPFYGILAVSQYSDIVLSYYLLAGMVCLMESFAAGGSDGATPRPAPRYAFLAGLMLGFLSFTKPEGMAAALVLVVLAAGLRLGSGRPAGSKRAWFLSLLFGLVLGALPTLLFELIFSPGNQTFINGFASAVKPSTFYRLKMILAFLVVECRSSKWNGLGLLLAGGMLLNFRTCFRKEMLLLPIFLTGYVLVIVVYYWINTYFEINWWLQVTLNRILFSLLPVALLWVFTAGWKNNGNDPGRAGRRIAKRQRRGP